MPCSVQLQTMLLDGRIGKALETLDDLEGLPLGARLRFPGFRVAVKERT